MVKVIVRSFKPKSTPDLTKKCCTFCARRPVYNIRSKYCLTCQRVVRRLKPKRLPRETINTIRDYVRKYDWTCYYTRMALDMTDPHSPWYCVFDHWVPHDNRKLVITSALVNEMKSDLSEKEFWCLIIMLANYKRHGTKIRKIKLHFWNRDEDPYGLDIKAQALRRPKGSRKCLLCGKRIPFSYPHTQYCRVCGWYIDRMHIRHFSPQTIADTSNYIHKNGYKCYFTKMSLEVNNYRSPWHCVLSHLVPGDSTKIVLTSSVLSVMKFRLLEKEFWNFVCQLADYKEKGKRIRRIKLACWGRPDLLDDI